jgi:hypothetical protein
MAPKVPLGAFFRHVWGQLLELKRRSPVGVYPTRPVPPRVTHTLRRRLFDALAAHFSCQQIEELTWRTAQCVAFNWHNEFLELAIEPEVVPVAVPTPVGRCQIGNSPAGT